MDALVQKVLTASSSSSSSSALSSATEQWGCHWKEFVGAPLYVGCRCCAGGGGVQAIHCRRFCLQFSHTDQRRSGSV